jgi:predicted nucleotidyltransferase
LNERSFSATIETWGKDEGVHMTETDRIRAELQNSLPALRERYHIKELGLFGSYVRGDNTVESDIDILVDFDRTVSLLAFVALKRELSELLKKNVDLVMKRALKPHIGKQVLQEVKYI